jgi:hypothetical protein
MSDDSDLPEQVPVDDNGDGEASAREDVGYCKPPRSTRFKPRQSGNPRGRPPGARGLRAELQAELGERLPITINNRCRRLSKRQIILKTLATKALSGDIRAAEKLLELVIRAEGFVDVSATRPQLSENDERIIDLLLSGGEASNIVSPSQKTDTQSDGTVISVERGEEANG